jgi:glycosyltransferase involved in cell wall biosynthesis
MQSPGARRPRKEGATPKSPYVIVAADFVETGGMDRANYALARYLAHQGHAVNLVTFRAAEELARTPGVSLHRVTKPADAYTLGGPLLAVAGLRHARRVALNGGVAVVNGGNCAFPAANWVHYVHAAFEPVTSGPRWRRAKARVTHRVNVQTERLALRVAKVVLANSERTRSDLVRHIGLEPERVRTVYYGTDPAVFRPPTAEERFDAREGLGWRDDRPRVAFIGGLGDRRKGFDVVYDAWRTLCHRLSWDADLVVVGRGAELSAWRQRAEADGISHRIEFLGFRSDVPRILAGCDALVAPTRYEAYGLGVHEALCCGLPSLVSAAAGIAERYPALLRSLLLEDPDSTSGLVAALSAWRDGVEALRPLVADFAAMLRTRTWDDMAMDIVRVCGETVVE